MRITIVQGAFLPVPPILGGAVEKIWFALGKEFARRGHQVTHISRDHVTLKREELVEGVRHIRIPGFDTPRSLVRLKWRDLLYSRRAIKVLPEADILVTNTFWLPLLRPELKRGKLYVHVARYPKGQIKFYRKAVRLQTVSRAVKEAICREAPDLASRVIVIPYFMDSPSVLCPDSKRSTTILYVGRVHPEKGIHILLGAFERLSAEGLRNWKLRIVGPWEVKYGGGGEQYLETLHKQSQKFGHLVEWTGPVFDAEALAAHYRQSALFVYPSLAEHGESFGLAPLEAMAAGCPPVVSSLECFEDFVKPGLNGWSFNHRSADGATDLATVLERAITETDTLTRVRECALRTAQEFSLAKVADQFLSDFEEIAR
jgi:glycosyltransferase involved in cell wall biosynthesis